MSGKCRKCGCTKYEWNPVSAVQKVASGFQISVSGDGKVISGQISASGLPLQDNKSDQTAYRNCMCGHHANYHA
jgi:hypothetical protein